MAAYQELLSISGDATFVGRVRVATWVAADLIRAEAVNAANHANRMRWAQTVSSNQNHCTQHFVLSVLAQKRALSAAAILGLTDNQLQAAVTAAVDIIAGI